MEKVFNSLPEHIQVHLREILRSSGLPDNEESLEAISKNWMDKKNLFQAQIKSLDMIETGTFGQEMGRPRPGAGPRRLPAQGQEGGGISVGPR